MDIRVGSFLPKRGDWQDRVSGISSGGHLLKIVRRRIALILACIVVVIGATAAYVYTATPRYTARLELLLESKGGSVFDIGSAVAGQLQDEAMIASELGVIKSRSLAKRVIEKLDLAQDPELNQRLEPPGPLAGLWDAISTGIPGYHDEARSGASEANHGRRGEEKIIDAFIQRVDAKQIPRSRTISVTYTSANPETAATVLNTLAELYLMGHLQDKFESAQRASNWLAGQVQTLKQRVEESERAVENYRQKYGLFAGQRDALINEQISNLSVRLLDASIAARSAEASLTETRRLMNSAGDNLESATRVLDSPVIQHYREEEMQLDRKQAEYIQKYGAIHPMMVELRAERDSFRQKVRAEINKISRSEEYDARIARERESVISRDLEVLKKELAQSNEATIGLNRLERDAEANRLLLHKLQGAFVDANELQDVGSQVPDGRLISPAAIPDQPSYPKKGAFIAIAFVAASMIGGLLAVTFEVLDGGCRSAHDIEAITGAPVLSHVPRVAALKARRTDISHYLIKRPKSAFAESIRSLYTRLLLSLHPPQVILLVSSVADEGKTAVALALARQQAEAGLRVVLVDADVRCSRLATRIPGLAASPGFGEVLAGTASLGDVIQPDPLSKAHIIVAGKSRIDRLDVAQTEAIRGSLSALQECYQLVIVEAAPILAMPDAHMLETVADATLMIVRWGKTRRHVVQYAVEQIRRFGGRVDGVVLSMIDLNKNATYGQGDSEYYSGKFAKYYSG